jgi:predicted short-subunit dehydrogenase-like oxidoreductase (DUF2520 family)
VQNFWTMKIALIGAGNLATQFGISLLETGNQVLQVYSRTIENAKELGDRLNCPFTEDLADLVSNADLFIIAVTDESIEFILASVNFGDSLVVHTAGGVSIDIFNPYCKNFGVLYPLQTFSKEKRADFSEIPLCIEANSQENLEILKSLAVTISEKVKVITSGERIWIHLAAVFASNFVNHFYMISKILLEDNNLDFELLKPLIKEAASKAVIHSPETVQTGPAVRNDKTVMNKHLEMLSDYPEWERLYQLISENIYNIHKQ